MLIHLGNGGEGGHKALHIGSISYSYAHFANHSLQRDMYWSLVHGLLLFASGTSWCDGIVSPVLCVVCRWVAAVVRGVDDDPVTPKDKVKSINSCKSFEPLRDMAGVTRWLQLLAEEVAERVAEDEAEHSRRPRSLGGWGKIEQKGRAAFSTG